jgi:hypothetical protein
MFLITDGTLGEMTRCMVVERKEAVEDAVLLFMLHTDTPKDQVTVNPVGEPLASWKFSPKLSVLRKCMACGVPTTDEKCADPFCGAFTRPV